MHRVADSFIQRHFANLRHIRNVFRIDPRATRGTGQVAPWLSGVVQLVHPAFPGSFQFNDPTTTLEPQPAAGNNFVVVIPPDEAWRIFALNFVFTTAVAAANREVRLIMDDSVNNFFRLPAISVQAASTVARYSFGLVLGYQVELGDTKAHGLPEIIMNSGWRIRSSIANIQAADQISALNIVRAVFPQ